eukprot:gene37664-45754_t
MSMPSPSPMPTLFVGDLPADCSEHELRALFEHFGGIASIRMKRGTPNKEQAHGGRGDASSKAFYYAFVKFESRQSAEMAHQTMEGYFFRGRTLRVGWASAADDGQAKAALNHGLPAAPALGIHAPPGSGDYHGYSNSSAMPYGMTPSPRPPGQQHGRTAQVHFSYLSKQLDFVISQAFLWEVFQAFGEVVEISLKKSTCDQDMCIQNGYGFAHYALSDDGIQSALRAVQALHQVTIQQVTYDCSVSNQLRAIISKMPPTH